MVHGAHKSRSFKRINVVTPSGKSKIRFDRKKAKGARCQVTGVKLAGVPSNKMRSNAKSSRRPSRPFGGVLTASAMKRVLIEKARKSEA